MIVTNKQKWLENKRRQLEGIEIKQINPKVSKLTFLNTLLNGCLSLSPRIGHELIVNPIMYDKIMEKRQHCPKKFLYFHIKTPVIAKTCFVFKFFSNNIIAFFLIHWCISTAPALHTFCSPENFCSKILSTIAPYPFIHN